MDIRVYNSSIIKHDTEVNFNTVSETVHVHVHVVCWQHNTMPRKNDGEGHFFSSTIISAYSTLQGSFHKNLNNGGSVTFPPEQSFPLKQSSVTALIYIYYMSTTPLFHAFSSIPANTCSRTHTHYQFSGVLERSCSSWHHEIDVSTCWELLKLGMKSEFLPLLCHVHCQKEFEIRVLGRNKEKKGHCLFYCPTL